MSVLVSIASPLVLLQVWFELFSLIVIFVFISTVWGISHSPTTFRRKTGNSFVLDSIVDTSHNLVLRSNTLTPPSQHSFVKTVNELIKYMFLLNRDENAQRVSTTPLSNKGNPFMKIRFSSKCLLNPHLPRCSIFLPLKKHIEMTLFQ